MLRIVSALCAPLLLAGCVSSQLDLLTAERLRVSAGQTPFYIFGPAQPNGPDFELTKGETVTLLRREQGYSRVRLYTGLTGYVSNSDVENAPMSRADARPTPMPKKKTRRSFVHVPAVEPPLPRAEASDPLELPRLLDPKAPKPAPKPAPSSSKPGASPAE